MDSASRLKPHQRLSPPQTVLSTECPIDMHYRLYHERSNLTANVNSYLRLTPRLKDEGESVIFTKFLEFSPENPVESWHCTAYE